MKNIFIVILLILAIGFTGCATSGSTGKSGKKSKSTDVVVLVKQAPTVKLTQRGRIYVGDKYTGLKKMVKQIKANGVKKDQRIVVQIPRNTSQNALKAIGRELASNGYVHVLFKQELLSSTDVGPDPLIKHLYEKPKNKR